MTFKSYMKNLRREKQAALEFQQAQTLQQQAQAQEYEQQHQKLQEQLQEQLRQQRELHEREIERLKCEQMELKRQEGERMRLERITKENAALELMKRKQREQRRKAQLKTTSPQAIRHLRDLVRMRYQLDTEIWALRGARRPDRPLVIEKMEKADAVMLEISTIVETWKISNEDDTDEPTWTEKEWKLAEMVKERIFAEGKRSWGNNPPWNDL